MAERPQLIQPPRLVSDEVEQLPPEWRAGGVEWRKASAALYGRLRGMIVDAIVSLKKEYPDTYGDYTPRPAALIAWGARQIADVYATDASIDYLDPETGEPIGDELVATAQRIRKAADTQGALLSAHEEAVATANGLVLTVPVIRQGENGPLLGVHDIVIQAHNCAWHLADHPESKDERDLTTFWVRMPVPGSNPDALNSSAIALITKSEAKWFDGPLAGKPLWPKNEGDEDTANPFGQIPVTVIRWSEPVPGDFLALCRADTLYQARALDSGYTMMGETDKEQGFGQWIGWNIGGSGAVKFGRRELIDLPTEPGKTDLKNVAPTPNQSGSLASLEAYMRTSVATQDLNPAALLRTTAYTAEGKKLEVMDRDNLRQRHLPQLARAEQRLYDLHRVGLAKLRGREVLVRAKLVVKHAGPKMPGNDLQEVQADERKLAMGLENPFTLYMAKKNVSLDAAKKAVVENLRITRELLGGLPTGGSSMNAPTKPEATDPKAGAE